MAKDLLEIEKNLMDIENMDQEIARKEPLTEGQVNRQEIKRNISIFSVDG